MTEIFTRNLSTIQPSNPHAVKVRRSAGVRGSHGEILPRTNVSTTMKVRLTEQKSDNYLYELKAHPLTLLPASPGVSGAGPAEPGRRFR